MTIKEYYRQAYKEMRGKPFKEKLEYFWEYFKFPFLIGLLVLALLIHGIVTIINHRDTAFSGVLLNVPIGADEKGFLQGYYDYTELDTAKQEALFFTNYHIKDDSSADDSNVLSKVDSDNLYNVVLKIYADEIDFIAGPPKPFEVFAYSVSGLLRDLREVIDEETFARYRDAGRIYYIDEAVRKQLEAEVGDEKPTPENYPDPKKPELMEEPIPVGIDVTKAKRLDGRIYYIDAVTYIGFTTNSQRKAEFGEFLDFLWSDPTRNENTIGGVFTNALSNANTQDFLQDYSKHTGLDAKEYEAQFYTNFRIDGENSTVDANNYYGIVEKIFAGEIDFIAGPPQSFEVFAYSTSVLLQNLQEVMDEETFGRYRDAGCIYYIDGAVRKQLETEKGDERPTPEDYPDPKKPELMEEPIPVGIDISNSSMLNGRIYSANTKTYIGFVNSSQQTERFMEFLDFLWSAE